MYGLCGRILKIAIGVVLMLSCRRSCCCMALQKLLLHGVAEAAAARRRRSCYYCMASQNATAWRVSTSTWTCLIALFASSSARQGYTIVQPTAVPFYKFSIIFCDNTVNTVDFL